VGLTDVVTEMKALDEEILGHIKVKRFFMS